MEEETDCPHCLSDCELTTYSTSITSTEFRWSKETYQKYICPLLDCATPEIWTLVPSAAWPHPLWWNGCEASKQPMGTSIPATPAGCLDPWDSNTLNQWLVTNWFLLLQRWMILLILFTIGRHLFLTNLHPVNDKSFPQKGNPEYNAYEKDIAVINLYFGDSTVFGDLLHLSALFSFSWYFRTQDVIQDLFNITYILS